MENKKTEIKVVVSWAIPWTAGFLYTLGLTADKSWDTLNGLVKFAVVIVYYFIWPLMLGAHYNTYFIK